MSYQPPQPYPEKLQPPLPQQRDMKALIWIGVLLFFIIAVIAIASYFGRNTITTPAASQTITFSGSGTHQTEYFTVPDNWTLDYSCVGFDNGIQGAMAVYVYGQGAVLQSVPVNTTCDLSGAINSTEMHQGGNIYLGVNATGQWSLTIHTHP